MPKSKETIDLKNKPLVEAIFELRWELQEGPEKGMRIDPHYKLLVGRIYEKLRKEYPFHEQLPTANMPDEIAGYVIQHRFRKDKNEWPLVQVGPGIISLNDTTGYLWSGFEKRISNVLDVLFNLYPEAEKNLKINGLVLRYIDAINFDYEKQDVFTFMKNQMKMNVNINKKLFEKTRTGQVPYGFDLRFSFPCDKPKGAIRLRYYKGKRNDSDKLIWETQIESRRNEAPNDKTGITKWSQEAHSLSHDWFFETIEGELRRRFE